MESLERVAIVGAGPIGLEAALAAKRRGFDVNVFESGSVGDSVRKWGHVRLFSSFGMNSSVAGRRLVDDLPGEDDFLTGAEYVDWYLKPLAESDALQGCVHEHTRVASVGRLRTTKTQLIGDKRRSRDPFRLLVDDGRQQKYSYADVVLDCSGTFPNHRWIGAGGMPCPGEHDPASQIEYTLPDIEGAAADRYANVTTAVIGTGYSAATSVVALASLAERHPETRCLWLTRGDRSEPMHRIPDDTLHARDTLSRRANELVSGDSCVGWLTDWHVEGIEAEQGRVRLTLVGDGVKSSRTVDRVIANVGYRPDNSLYTELHVHECYATQGPIKLAAALLGETSEDCLQQAALGLATLINPEPNFFILGAKSYGRNSQFLIRVGLEQIDQVMDHLANRLARNAITADSV